MKPQTGWLRVCSVAIPGGTEPTSRNSENFEAKGVHPKRVMLRLWMGTNSMTGAITGGEALTWHGSVIFTQGITLVPFDQQLPHRGEDRAE
jgi:hypothetical protein